MFSSDFRSTVEQKQQQLEIEQNQDFIILITGLQMIIIQSSTEITDSLIKMTENLKK